MTNPSQLFLLADHIKLSLLERQRAVSLDLEPNAQDGEISRSLESLQEGITSVEAEQTRLAESHDSAGAAALKDQLAPLHEQLRDLTSQFYGDGPDSTQASNSATPDLKQPVPQHPSSKSVRFMDNSAAAAAVQDEIDEEDDRNRSHLFRPYRDEPSPTVDQSNMSNEQIYLHHDQVMRDQDNQLDQLGQSIGRQHELSIQIGDELDGHVELLDGMDGDVDRHQGRLDGARRRLDRIRRKAGDNWSMMTIVGLIIILVILIVILK
ncbi:hypothetical protein N7448_009346 [Penicillium atrosanguineum]|uniref:Uncharacterized protein n=1 Tax=Penicillium atrosanguineum TaxID=1132637 RepID=A0A9W9KV24_9EURO|nr:RHO1 GDP-GTP exchange protein 2 [Penicillium atrosanguineum]KAJ5123249.1 hypothetical protein N7448_009346 [Penicillium atrosanguineum]KAJ5141879.1 hypothetical protein N7526_002874 [Penicillium atrosanguineum]KAJ5298476.1 RHO1 GDP-GTP exchange protein 2 [Penicillium atrosanguineum]KAJ5321258.1 hypothetical protein N7476_004260 [Penicillium atrosanguineum]